MIQVYWNTIAINTGDGARCAGFQDGKFFDYTAYVMLRSAHHILTRTLENMP